MKRKQRKKCTYNVALKCVVKITFAVEKEKYSELV